VSQPRWALFLAVAGLLTLAVVVLARQSQRLVEEFGQRDGSEPTDSAAAVAEPRQDRSAEAEGRHPLTETARTAGRAAASAPEATGDLTATDAPADRETGGEPFEREPESAGGQPEFQLTTGALLANVAVTQGLVAVIVLAAGWYFSIPADAFGVTGDPSSSGLPAVALGVGSGVLLWLGNEAATAFADAVGAAYDEALRGMLAPASTGGWLLLLGGVLPIIAISEELLFRAALIGVPAAGLGLSPWLLAVGSSVAFALGHGAQGRVGVVVTGGLGFVLAAGYVLSGSLLLVVVAHYVINALEFLVHERLGIDDFPAGRAGLSES